MTRPNEVSDDMLMALADGELPQSEAQRLQNVILVNPDLAARYADFVLGRHLVQQAFAQGPVPERLVDTILNTPIAEAAGTSKVVPFPATRRFASATGWGMALAASVVLAVGGFLAGRSTAPQLAVVAPRDAALALARTLTGGEVVLADGSTARALGSFETGIGFCRLIGSGNARHLACRESGASDWIVALSVSSEGVGAYLPAQDIATSLIDGVLDEIGAGGALSPAQEESLLFQ